MLVQTTFVALLLGATFTVEASMVSKLKDGELKFCGKQPCLAPNICLPFLGANVCVRTNIPKCRDLKCPSKYECALLQDVCETLPCHPKPYCVKKNPCGECESPDKFCELLPKPVCRFVVEPTCMNIKCGNGEICLKEPLECDVPPCRVKLHCVPAWPWRYAEDGVRGAKDGEAGGAGGGEGTGDAGGEGGSQGSQHTSGSGGSFGSNVPFAQTGASESETGGTVEGNAEGSKKKGRAKKDHGSDSDTDDDDD